MPCPCCLLIGCVCADIPRVVTRTQWLIVRHALEWKKPSNTGRLAARALGCPIIDVYRAGEGPPRLPVPEGAWVLFPDGPPTTARPRHLVVVDASWSQARRMVHRLFPKLPRFSLPPSPPIARFRRSPRADGMSTLEAMAAAVELLEGEPAARPLRELQECARAKNDFRFPGNPGGPR